VSVAEACVLGTGIDLVEIARMQQALKRWDAKFKNRVFLEGEQRYCESTAFPWIHYAGRFAVKEAVSKALGTGIGSRLSWLDIEVVRDAVSGAPSVALGRRARALLRERRAGNILISLSHTRSHAVAQALLVSGHPGGSDRRGEGTHGSRSERGEECSS
jgi:holo-[acyl-carrier protein] synthase